MYALGESGAPAHAGSLEPRPTGCSSKEIRRKGDWRVKRPNTEPSGWAFEFTNEFYPDIDDTAMVMLGLSHRARFLLGSAEGLPAAGARLAAGMQSSDGGWAAFDVDNNWEFLSNVPFADHNAMLDPTCPDITGRVLEALAALRREPQPSGGAPRRRISDAHAGAGRKLVRPLGRGLHLRHLLRAARVWRPRARTIARRTCCAAGEWLRSIQNADGGWGESCASYDNGVFTAARQHAVADGLGDSGVDRRRRYHQPAACSTASNILWKRSAPTAAGTRSWPPAPVFRGFSI